MGCFPNEWSFITYFLCYRSLCLTFSLILFTKVEYNIIHNIYLLKDIIQTDRTLTSSGILYAAQLKIKQVKSYVTQDLTIFSTTGRILLTMQGNCLCACEFAGPMHPSIPCLTSKLIFASLYDLTYIRWVCIQPV